MADRAEQEPWREQTSWLRQEVEYVGEGTALFGDPAVQVTGDCTVSFDARGAPRPIRMRVSRIEKPEGLATRFGDLELFHPAGRKNGAFTWGFAPSNPCESLEVHTEAGRFVANTPVHYSPQWTIPPSDPIERIQFHPTGGVYWESEEEEADHWVFFLLNLDTKLLSTYAPGTADHTLRLWRATDPPPGLEEHQAELWRRNSLYGRPALEFEGVGGGLGFLERVPAHEEVWQQLAERRRAYGVTAVAVGDAWGASADTIRGLLDLPFELTALLGLCTGRSVGYRWVEWRTGTGALVARSHVWHAPTPGTGNRIQAIRAHGSYMARLLSTALSRPEVKSSWFKVVVNHMLLSAESSTYEERLTHLFLALESCTERYGTSVQNLRDGLSPSVLTALDGLVAEAAEAISRLSGDPVDTSVLDGIRSRLDNLYNVDRRFGLAVRELLRVCGFETDIKVAEEAYAARRREQWPATWAEALSRWRGNLLHGGALILAPAVRAPSFYFDCTITCTTVS